MTNNKLQSQIDNQLSQTYADLQDLRDSVTTSETMLIINEMLSELQKVQEKCYLLSNREDVYKA